MQAFIGLSNRFVKEQQDLIDTLESLGCYSLDDAKGILTTREYVRLRVFVNVCNHPELNLWKQHPSTL